MTSESSTKILKKLLISGLILILISCASGHHKPFKEQIAPIRDLSVAQTRIQMTVSSSPYLSLKEIGHVTYEGFQAPVRCVFFRPEEPVFFKVLVNAGIHGNEPAGVAYAMQFVKHLADNPDRYSTVAIDIIPIVNPWGWVHDTRYNRDGIDINRDFSTFNSREANIIADFLKNKQYDLMLDLHEDGSARGFYVYQYGMDDKTIVENLVETIEHMGYPIEEKVSVLLLKAENGIIDAPVWGLWYMQFSGQMAIAHYYRMNHSQRVYTIETPIKLAMPDRVCMQRTAVEGLIEGNRNRAENDDEDN
jgi:hypothetical protein